MNNIEKEIYSIIDSIKNELKKPLPGIESQLRMAPKSRLENLLQKTEDSKKSGVLLLLYYKNDNLHLVFIKRAVNGSVHSGQISFPGGKYDEGDNDLIYTSLRETHEEIGVKPSEIEILGNLTTLFIPVSNYIVFPCIGYCAKKPDFVLNESEVDGLIEIPLKDFLDEQNLILDLVEVRGTQFEVPVFKVKENKIWGATAMIMNEFVHLLKKMNLEF